MSKLNQTKIPLLIDDDGILQHIAVEQGVVDNEFNWKLVRERDGLTKQSNGIKWIEWNEDGTFKADFQEPAPSRSLLMSPFNNFFTWQTTLVTEIIEQRENYIKFKTGNSTYELFKLYIPLKMRDPNEDTDLDNTEYDGWTTPETTEYNDDDYDY
jgi:hypothetical protein